MKIFLKFSIRSSNLDPFIVLNANETTLNMEIFCGLTIRFFIFLVSRKLLIFLLINIVRNFPKEITDFRNRLLNKINLDINNYLNNQYNLNDLNKIIDIVKNIIN
jgi:hypothetical protein